MRKFYQIAGAALLLLVVGCAAPLKTKEIPVFFPPAPNSPESNT